MWEDLVRPETLWRAWRTLQRGKARRPDIARFALDAELHVLDLSRRLAAETWRPGELRLLFLADPKHRVISAAPVLDRVVHHALYAVVGARLERRFVPQSYACRPGRGTHRALLAFQGHARRHPWALRLDVRHYFYSINREILAHLLLRHLPEPQLQRLILQILDSGSGLYRSPRVLRWLGWLAPPPSGRGLPIGNLTSQWWANQYLDGLDHHVLRDLRLPTWLRYMDDFVCFAHDRQHLLEVRQAIATWLRDERGLELKDPLAEPRTTRRPLSWLGHVVHRDHITLGAKGRRRMRRRIAQRLHAPAALEATLSSYAAILRFGEPLATT